MATVEPSLSSRLNSSSSPYFSALRGNHLSSIPPFSHLPCARAPRLRAARRRVARSRPRSKGLTGEMGGGLGETARRSRRRRTSLRSLPARALVVRSCRAGVVAAVAASLSPSDSVERRRTITAGKLDGGVDSLPLSSTLRSHALARFDHLYLALRLDTFHFISVSLGSPHAIFTLTSNMTRMHVSLCVHQLHGDVNQYSSFRDDGPPNDSGLGPTHLHTGWRAATNFESEWIPSLSCERVVNLGRLGKQGRRRNSLSLPLSLPHHAHFLRVQARRPPAPLSYSCRVCSLNLTLPYVARACLVGLPIMPSL